MLLPELPLSARQPERRVSLESGQGDVVTGKERAALQYPGGVTSVALSGDGTLGGTVRLWAIPAAKKPDK